MPDKKVRGVIIKLVIADILSNFSAQIPATKPINANNKDPNKEKTAKLTKFKNSKLTKGIIIIKVKEPTKTALIIAAKL